MTQLLTLTLNSVIGNVSRCQLAPLSNFKVEDRKWSAATLLHTVKGNGEGNIGYDEIVRLERILDTLSVRFHATHSNVLEPCRSMDIEIRGNGALCPLCCGGGLTCGVTRMPSACPICNGIGILHKDLQRLAINLRRAFARDQFASDIAGRMKGLKPGQSVTFSAGYIDAIKKFTLRRDE